MNARTNIIEKAAWLSYAAFWGLAVGLLLLVFTISPTGYGSGLGLATFIPLILVAVGFPIVGAICDRTMSHHIFVATLTFITSLLFLFDVITGFRLQTGLLLVFGLPGLVIGFFAPFTTYAQASFRHTLQKNALYFVAWSGSLLTLILIQRAFVDINSFINFYYTLLIISGLLACLLFILQSEANWNVAKDQWPKILQEEFQKSVANDLNTQNFRILLLAATIFVAGSWNATRLSLDLWQDITLQTNLITLPLILLTVILASAYTPRLIRSFGPKRHFTAMCLLVLILGNAQLLASTGVEYYILLLFHISILTSNLINIFSLGNWLIPQNRIGQGIAWLAWCVVLGYGLGEAIFDLPHIFNALICFVALLTAGVVIQFFCKSGIDDSSEDETTVNNLLQRGGPLLTWPTDAHTPHSNAQHNWLTSILQSLARFAAEIFFARIRIVGAKNLNVTSGAILVANHPNTFLDPMLITALSPGRLHYWAKSTLWSLPFLGSILDRLGAIPVYRRQDKVTQEGQKTNAHSLTIAAEKLRNGGWILIFPEGVSEPGLSLKPLKTGAARLGFQALTQNNWEANVPIIPIGIDYMEPGIFRSNITLRIGQPVELKDYQQDHQKSYRDAVRKATQDLSNRMKHLLPHLDEQNLESLVMRIYHLYGERVLEILECKDETEARRKIAQAVNHYQQLDSDTVKLFNQRLDTYWQEHERLSTPENHEPIRLQELLKIFIQLHSFAGFGLLTNWIPYKLTGRCVELLSLSSVWLATGKLGIGAVLFGTYYGLIFTILAFVTTPLIAFAATFLIMIAGILALGAMDRFAFRLHQFHTLWQAFWTQDTDDNIDEMRISLIQDLERFRETYAFYKDHLAEEASETSMDAESQQRGVDNPEISRDAEIQPEPEEPTKKHSLEEKPEPSPSEEPDSPTNKGAT